MSSPAIRKKSPIAFEPPIAPTLARSQRTAALQKAADAFVATSAKKDAVASPYRLSAKELARGDSGDAVRLLQDDLVALGYMTQAGMNTGPGIFGPRTQAGVKDFQREHGLPQTGSTDHATRAAMRKALDELAQFDAHTIRRGMTNASVRSWQAKLVEAGYLSQAVVDAHPGVFGGKTEAATKKFQGDHGLNVSGACGVATRAKMKKVLAGEESSAPGKDGQVRPVPYINQLTSDGGADDWNAQSNCGPTSVAMIAKAFGKFAGWRDGDTVEEVRRLGGVGPDGAGADTVAAMGRAAGLTSYGPVWGAQLDWIRSQLAQGHLVAANGNRGVTLENASFNDGVTGGHWIVVTGIDQNGNFLVNDPSTDCHSLTPEQLQRYFNSHEYGGAAVAFSQ